MRDRKDNFVVVCSIENVDPMGVHTGDSITVAPAMTLTDRQYQEMRDDAKRIISRDRRRDRRLQHPVRRQPGDRPPRRHRDQPARVALVGARLQGHRLPDRQDRGQAGRRLHPRRADERHHEGQTSACFEPAIDYVVVKAPRFATEKFGDFPTLTTHMKSVGEAMAIGRTFKEALQKALRGLESGKRSVPIQGSAGDAAGLLDRCRTPHDGRLYTMMQALRAGAGAVEVAAATGIDPWFVDQMEQIPEISRTVAAASPLDAPIFRPAKPPGSPTPSSPSCAACTPTRSASGGTRSGCGRSTSRRHLRRRVPGTHPVPLLHVRRRRTRSPAGDRPRSSSWAAGRTGSARASSSTTPACTRRSRCATPG